MEQVIASTTGHFGKPSDAAAVPDDDGRRDATEPSNLEQSVERKHVYAGREWSSEHPLNIRVSMPLGVGRYYITLVAGRERRARARLALDRRQNPLDTPGNALFLAFVLAVATSGTITLFYLLLAHLFHWSGRLMF